MTTLAEFIETFASLGGGSILARRPSNVVERMRANSAKLGIYTFQLKTKKHDHEALAYDGSGNVVVLTRTGRVRQLTETELYQQTGFRAR